MTNEPVSVGEVLEWPGADCCMGRQSIRCICPDMERALRGYIRGADMPPMSPGQRAKCVAEIGQVEGYRREDYEAADDAGLARGVLDAWTDYCRDKGLLP